ncbi:Conserved hypothetical protein [Shewanella piezotolerans WP3]|uniref:Uncharacterized protein n=1 Tax=Shewanella piezotolerans (strain WP3 / JCM 13877) TaxID=225849 RepID=B8CHE9_SHEPW|nr:hypothetical protein [Shewanella piezotolerans]ACJ27075.1 Conserved hypothetical protein [Shewanella piezotolerans WP3]
MRNNLLLIGLVNLCLSSSAYALSPEQFTSLEYHVNTGVGKTLPYAANKITPEFKKAFSFIKFDEDTSIKLVTFIDTPNRAFKEKAINIRVREHVTKPRKSKITVKLRAADPTSFGDVSNYRKAEIDYTNGKAAYSVSYDIPYSPGDIDVKKVDYEQVFKILKGNSAVWGIVGDIYEANKQDLAQTVVMRTHGWEGTLDDKRFDDIEIDFQLWTPYYRQPRVAFTEFSFKGSLKDEKRLEQAYNYLFKQVNAVNLGEGDNQGSKTNATFKMSKAFK